MQPIETYLGRIETWLEVGCGHLCGRSLLVTWPPNNGLPCSFIYHSPFSANEKITCPFPAPLAVPQQWRVAGAMRQPPYFQYRRRPQRLYCARQCRHHDHHRHRGERGDRTSTAVAGGSGGLVTAIFAVTPGQTIRVIAGGAGADGFTGGGGVGAGTAVINCGDPANCATGTLLVVAGAGGGARSNGVGAGNISFGGGGGAASKASGGGGINSAGDNGSDGGTGGGQGSKTAVSAGGGGGYSGGAGEGAGSGGSGGTNFVDASGTSVTNVAGTNGGSGLNNTNGSVTLSFTSVLPVELTRFTARQDGPAVLLEWQTASERNNEGFSLERSVDARTWQPIGFVAGQGTFLQPQSYRHTDEYPLRGRNYYRLRQVDFAGQSLYLPIVPVDVKRAGCNIGRGLAGFTSVCWPMPAKKN